MTDQAARWRRVEQLCAAALERAEVERATFLRAACGDDETLRHEVEQLLAHDSQADGFLHGSVATVAAAVLGLTGASLTGRRLNALEVGPLIGAGGMGEVYRARDTELKRDVALKVLPAALSGDAERLARFRREAEVLASLNHPNIAAIYGLVQSGGIVALVIELVEGEDLSARIARGAIPLEDALPIAKQIAEALEAAHEKGIIHRDLKPANIKVRADGVVKVLDFGLAKLGQPELTDSDAGVTAVTSPAPTTGVGAILGTAAYMSPEQARGRAMDKRADIWAFGCVLYEMLTGRPAFKRDHVADTLAAVLHQNVEWTALPASTPSPVRRLIARCLERDLRRRLRDVGEARIVLEDDAALGSRDNQEVPATTSRHPLWRRGMPIVFGALVTAALTSAATLYVTQSQARPIVTRVPLTLNEGEVFPGGTRQFVAISPDGAQIAYVVNGRGLYLRSMGSLEARLIAAGEFNSTPLSPVFSPDSRSVAFWSTTEQAIKRVSVGGGAAVTICPAEQQPFGMTWIEGAIVFGAGRRGIMRVSDSGGTPMNIVSVQASEEAHGPQVLPGGDMVLFTLATGPGLDRWEKAQIVAQSLRSGQRTILVAGGSDGRYMPTGHLVFARQGVLLAVPMSLSRLQVTGGAVPIVEGVRRAQQNATGAAQFSVASTGSLVYVSGPLARAEDYFDLALIDRRGSVKPIGLPPGFYQHPRVSPDGKRIAFTIDNGKDANIWVYDLVSTTSMRRLTNGGNNRFSIWSSDGKWIVFQSDRDGAHSIFRQRSDGSTGAAERLTKAEEGTSHVPDAWLPGAERLLFDVTRGSSVSLWSLSVPDKKGTPIPGVESSNPLNASLSPDGHWIAYSTAETAGSMIYVQAFPVSASGARYPVSSRGLFPVWSRQGLELVSQPPGGQWAIQSIITEPSFAFSRPVQISRGGSITNAGADSCGDARPDPTPCAWRNYDTTSDGGFVGVVLAGQAASVGAPRAQIQVVINWFEELKSRVPTK